MQDKRVSRNEAGYSDKHRPAVPFGAFKEYSFFQHTVLTLRQFRQYLEINHCFREKRSIPNLSYQKGDHYE